MLASREELGKQGRDETMNLSEKSHVYAFIFVAMNGVMALVINCTRTLLNISFEEALIEVFMLEFFQVVIILLYIVLLTGYPKITPQ